MGCAVSDELGMVATAAATLHVKSMAEAVEKVLELYTEREAGGTIVGLPTNMDGTEGPMAKSARAFAALLAARTGTDVRLVDERMTSKIAERALIEADMSRKRRKDVIDRVAAQVILQSFLDGMPSTVVE